MKLYEFNLSNLLNAILKAANEDVTLTYNNVYKEVYELKTVDEVFEYVYDLAINVQLMNSDQIKHKADHNMTLIIDYMKNNFGDKNLNLEQLANEVNYSISYITTLFKQIKQSTFVKKLTEIRMEKAKEILLNSQTKIIEIAHLVGYNDPYYFSHSFKKYFGVSPKEYRDENI